MSVREGEGGSCTKRISPRKSKWKDESAEKKSNEDCSSTQRRTLVRSCMPSQADTKNPAHYCFNCTTYLGFRGFCSKNCHDEYYDKMLVGVNQ